MDGHPLNPDDYCNEWSTTIPRMVTNQPKDGHPTEGSVLQTRNLALKFCSQNEELDENFHGWSPTISRMVTPQPKDVHPPKENVVQTWNLALKFNSQNNSQVPT